MQLFFEKITPGKIWAVIFIYCALFAWMSVPFVTTEKALLRKQVMFIDNLEDEIGQNQTVHEQVVATNAIIVAD